MIEWMMEKDRTRKQLIKQTKKNTQSVEKATQLAWFICQEQKRCCPLPSNSEREKRIVKCVTIFIPKYLRANWIVENLFVASCWPPWRHSGFRYKWILDHRVKVSVSTWMKFSFTDKKITMLWIRTGPCSEVHENKSFQSFSLFIRLDANVFTRCIWLFQLEDLLDAS